ncbi:hypothetical protein [Polyangium jinanense]|uniref:Uncharacterized protein n=1 Tax=Polyangium jinanense TaxID=2829994 RepID=A0A9X3XFK9_9BACT|nr:hypothetical protein [Polyangium jinanense]MDC3988480.1 hypothetical protein [Polyangium jinanense]
MGEVIRKRAPVKDIFADTRTTYDRAVVRGGTFQALAEQRLGPVLAVVSNVEAQIAEVEAKAGPALAALSAENGKADKLLGKVSDDIWNALGRPAVDPHLSLLFPGGIALYTDGDVATQPRRMELLVSLLRRQVHPRLPGDVREAAANTVEEAAALLRAKVEPAMAAKTQLEMLGRVRTALGRAAQMELANLKRLYKGHGLREVDIHEVIPTRSRASGKKGAEPAEPVG